jgi:hypothetical protein
MLSLTHEIPDTLLRLRYTVTTAAEATESVAL